jgi:hypothetical protein
MHHYPAIIKHNYQTIRRRTHRNEHYFEVFNETLQRLEIIICCTDITPDDLFEVTELATRHSRKPENLRHELFFHPVVLTNGEPTAEVVHFAESNEVAIRVVSAVEFANFGNLKQEGIKS